MSKLYIPRLPSAIFLFSTPLASHFTQQYHHTIIQSKTYNIRLAMRRIIELKGLHCSNKAQALAALDYYVEKNIDWTDAFMASQLIAKGIHELYSFDKHFDRLDDLTKIEP